MNSTPRMMRSPNWRMVGEKEQRTRIDQVVAEILSKEHGEIGGHTPGQRPEACPRCKEMSK